MNLFFIYFSEAYGMYHI